MAKKKRRGKPAAGPPVEPRKGRPSLLTAALIDEVGRVLPRCLYLETFADLVGASRRSVRRWNQQGRAEQAARDADRPAAPDGSPADLACRFLAAVKRAIAEAEAQAVEAVTAARATHWQAGAWLLERRHPERWAAARGDLAELARLVREQQAEIHALRRAIEDAGKGPG